MFVVRNFENINLEHVEFDEGKSHFVLFLGPVVKFRCSALLGTPRSKIPVFGLTGRAPGWPGGLKLPGAAV